MIEVYETITVTHRLYEHFNLYKWEFLEQNLIKKKIKSKEENNRQIQISEVFLELDDK